MIGISYGNYAGQLQYPIVNQNEKKNSQNAFKTELSNEGSHIKAVPDGSWATCAEVNRIPSKYALKSDDAITWHWRQPGAEYRFFHAAESTEENPVLVVRGVNEQGKLFEEKINVRQIDPRNITVLEIEALEHFRPGECKAISYHFGDENRGLQERFDYVAVAHKYIEACNRGGYVQSAAGRKEELDFICSFTGSSAESDMNAFSLDDFFEENKKNLELCANIARERLIAGMAKRCSEELSDLLWKK